MTSVAYNPIPTPSTGVTVLKSSTQSTGLTFGNLNDGYWSGIPMPFSFNYFGTSYANIAVNVNGFINPGSFGVDQFGYGTAIPNAAVPNNTIGGIQANLDLRYSGKLECFSNGVSPNQRFVINYENVPFFDPLNSPGSPVNDGTASFQIHLLENGSIEFHTTAINGNTTSPDYKVQGIENLAGTVAYTVPGRNNQTNWKLTAPDAYRISNYVYNYSWLPVTGLSNPAIKNPMATVSATTIYTVNVANSATGCSKSSSVLINQYTPATPKVYPGDSVICSGNDFLQYAKDLTGPYAGGYPSGTTID